jgi:hypothetical protein
MSKFFLTDAPAMAPGVCWVTKTSVGPFIDTGVDLSLRVIDRGRIYLSVDALREMAQVAGLFDEKEPISVELKKQEWYDRGYNDAIKELDQDVINSFVGHVSRNAVGVASTTALVESAGHTTAAGAAVPGPSDATAGTPENSSGVDKVKRKSSSTGSVKRPASVSANSSDESNFRL